MTYRPLDHTADLGFVIEADTVDRVFEDAAVAFTEAITPLAEVRPRETETVRLRADDLETLMVEWLGELLFRFDADGRLPATAEVRIDERPPGGGVALEATVRGETFVPGRHRLRVSIKAVTYHGLEVRRDGDRWRATVILDV